MNCLKVENPCIRTGLVSIRISADVDGYAYPSRDFVGYSEREAIKMYRQAFGLVGKHLEYIDTTILW